MDFSLSTIDEGLISENVTYLIRNFAGVYHDHSRLVITFTHRTRLTRRDNDERIDVCAKYVIIHSWNLPIVEVSRTIHVHVI